MNLGAIPEAKIDILHESVGRVSGGTEAIEKFQS